jgi:hypothetical protein
MVQRHSARGHEEPQDADMVEKGFDATNVQPSPNRWLGQKQKGFSLYSIVADTGGLLCV